ncbi:DUF927 domain-containing protein [Ruminococcus sp.]|uniref:DUF927 domain-containing protein n=1 Tax=Ruminococcus sp. TaxID=41978 RepID=UPI00386660BE
MADIIIPEFTRDDFLNGTEPYEWLYQYKDNPLQTKQLMVKINSQALSFKIRNFMSMFKDYVQMMNSKSGLTINNTTNFSEQEMVLDCGDWECDDFGVTGTDKFGFEFVACNHPILPIQRLVNIDSGVEKQKLAYRKNKQWRYVIADKKTLASAQSIINLAEFGIAVNSENSKHLIRYLSDIEHYNYEKIPEVNSVGRLGWIDDYGFSPYGEDLIFDGDVTYKHFFESVKEHGKADKWFELVKKIRKGNTSARLILASSFASVLVKPCNSLVFFVHLWGGTESGKTVALMLATSVWANPKSGEYWHTFNSTAVAQELSAGFVNSMPLIIDELQIVKDRKDFDTMIYQLSEGVGRSRGQKTGGLQKVQTWSNCIITTGEMPISNNSSGAGAVNRVIEIDCKDLKLFENPVEVADTIKKNYGFAGKMFVEMLQEPDNTEYAIKCQKDFYKLLSNGKTTEKQAMAASIILTADKLIDEWIFKDGQTLNIEDID